MLLAEKRKRQEVAGKVNHPEYIYRLNGEGAAFDDNRGNARPQQHLQQQQGNDHGNGGGGGRQQNYNRDRQPRPPPFAVDDDGPGNRNVNSNNHNRLVPAGGAGGNTHNSMQMQAYQPNAAPLQFGGGGGGGYYQPQRQQQQPRAGSPGIIYAPTLPPMGSPSQQPLQGPLPPVYRPKPPLIFHSGGGGQPYYPQQPYYGNGDGLFPALPAVQPIQLSPIRSPTGGYGGFAPQQQQQQRPYTSPPLPAIRGNNSGDPPSRPQSRGAGGGGGDKSSFIFGGGDGGGGGGGGMSEQDIRQREKMAARQRALELQADNARQITEAAQRKAAAKALEAQEARSDEARLEREREARARREQSEVDKEERERQLQMMGPRAAQALVAQQEADRLRREEESAAKRQARELARAEAAQQNGAAAAGGGVGVSFTPNPALGAAVPAHNSNDSNGSSSNIAGLRVTLPPPQQPPSTVATTLGAQLAPPPTQPYNLQYQPYQQQQQRRDVALPRNHPSNMNSSSGSLGVYSYEAEAMKMELRHIAETQRNIEQLLGERVAAVAGEAAGLGLLLGGPASRLASGGRLRSGGGGGGVSGVSGCAQPTSYLQQGAAVNNSPNTNANQYQSLYSISAIGDGGGSAQQQHYGTTTKLTGAGRNLFTLNPSRLAAAATSDNNTSSSSVNGNTPRDLDEGVVWKESPIKGSDGAPLSYLDRIQARRLPGFQDGAGAAYLPPANPQQQQQYGSNITVLASQVHSWASPNTLDPDDISLEPSKFVGPFVPRRSTGKPLSNANSNGTNLIPSTNAKAPAVKARVKESIDVSRNEDDSDERTDDTSINPFRAAAATAVLQHENTSRDTTRTDTKNTVAATDHSSRGDDNSTAAAAASSSSGGQSPPKRSASRNLSGDYITELVSSWEDLTPAGEGEEGAAGVPAPAPHAGQFTAL